MMVIVTIIMLTMGMEMMMLFWMREIWSSHNHSANVAGKDPTLLW